MRRHCSLRQALSALRNQVYETALCVFIDRSYFIRSVQFPVTLMTFVLPTAAALGQLLSTYGYWGYTLDRSRTSWFALTVIIAAFALLGAWALASQFQSMYPVLVGVAGQFCITLTLVLLLPFQELIIGIISQSASMEIVFGLPGNGISGMHVIVCVCLLVMLGVLTILTLVCVVLRAELAYLLRVLPSCYLD